MPANPITRRLASRLHIAQLEAMRRAAGVERAVQRKADEAARAIMSAVSESSTQFDFQRIRTIQNAVEPLWRMIAQAVFDQLKRMADYSHEQAVRTLLETVPRKWWRAVVPTLPVKEAIIPSPFGGQIPPVPPIFIGAAAPAPDDFPQRLGAERRFLSPGLVADIEHEPILRGGMSKEEFDKLVKELIFPPPSAEKINRWVFSTDWPQRLGNLSRKIGDPLRVANEITMGYSQGENIQQLTKRVRDVTDVAASSAKRIARTEAMRIAGTAQNENFNKLGDLEIGRMHNAQIDQNSRPEHAALNGKIYYHDPEPGQLHVSQMVIEPGGLRLPNCRCWSSPVLREPEPDDPALAPVLQNASGQEIPDPAVYDRWFQQADEGTRKEAVGASRYRAAKDRLGRDPDWIDLVDTDGKLLSRQRIESEDEAERFQRRSEVYAMFRQREELLRQVSSQGFVLSR